MTIKKVIVLKKEYFMGFRINGFNNDNPLNQMGGVTLSSSIRFTGSSYRTVGNSNKNSGIKIPEEKQLQQTMMIK